MKVVPFDQKRIYELQISKIDEFLSEKYLPDFIITQLLSSDSQSANKSVDEQLESVSLYFTKQLDRKSPFEEDQFLYSILQLTVILENKTIFKIVEKLLFSSKKYFLRVDFTKFIRFLDLCLLNGKGISQYLSNKSSSLLRQILYENHSELSQDNFLDVDVIETFNFTNTNEIKDEVNLLIFQIVIIIMRQSLRVGDLLSYICFKDWWTNTFCSNKSIQKGPLVARYFVKLLKKMLDYDTNASAIGFQISHPIYLIEMDSWEDYIINARIRLAAIKEITHINYVDLTSDASNSLSENSCVLTRISGWLNDAAKQKSDPSFKSIRLPSKMMECCLFDPDQLETIPALLELANSRSLNQNTRKSTKRPGPRHKIANK